MTCPSIRFLSFCGTYFGEEFRSANIVDVLDDQGFLQIGIIVGKAANGVLVDFFCKGQLPRLVGHGECFYWDLVHHFDGIDMAGEIEVFLRPSNDRPFAWYPAEWLDMDTSRNSDALVEVKLEFEGAVVKEIVHYSQIRNVAIDLELRTVDECHYETGSYPIPDSCASLTDSSPLWTMCYRGLEKAGGTLTVRIGHGHLEYLLQGQLDDFDLEHHLNWSMRRMYSCLEKGLVWYGNFFSRSPVAVLPDDGSSSAPFRCLPGNILVETFQFLESSDRVRLRRVCPQWNGILRMKAIFKDVWVSLTYRYDCPLKWSAWDTLHAVVLALTKLVTTATKWVIIVGSGDNCEPTDEDQHINQALLGLISDIGRYLILPCTRKLNFIIFQFRWRLGRMTYLQHEVEKMANLCTQCTSVCDTLVWKDCTFAPLGRTEALLPIRKGSVKTASPTLKADLLEMLNCNAPKVNLEELSQWLTQGTGTGEVWSILQQFQTGNPHITAHSTLYHVNKLERVEVDKLDVGRLNRLTQWQLYAEMAECAPRGIERPLDESNEHNGTSDEGSVV